MTTGIFCALRVGDRRDERGLVERRERDARHAARDEALDLGDLRVAIVLAQRTAPDHVDAELLRRLLRARRGCSARRRGYVPFGMTAIVSLPSPPLLELPRQEAAAAPELQSARTVSFRVSVSSG